MLGNEVNTTQSLTLVYGSCTVDCEQTENLCGYIPAENLALGKPAFQSSLHYSGYPSKAVDGDREDDLGAYNFNPLTCSHTENDHESPWWAVDLGGPVIVTQVVIVNRGDCCG